MRRCRNCQFGLTINFLITIITIIAIVSITIEIVNNARLTGTFGSGKNCRVNYYLQSAETREEYPEQTALPVLRALFSSAAAEMLLLKNASVSYSIFDVTHLQMDLTLYKSDVQDSVR